MRYLINLVLLIIIVKTGYAQKHDYMWSLGLGPNWSDYNFFLDFKGVDSPSVIIRTDTMSTGPYTASYANNEGNILLYTNGLWILNKYGNFIENSGGLHPTLTGYQYNYPGGQSGFFLEKVDNPNIIYFVSLDFGLHPAQEWPYKYVGQNLMVATIDIQANNGAGKVLEKNKILLTGTLMSPTACRHANGRDWWIMVSDADENRHYRILLNPEGFALPDTQLIGTKPNPIPYNGGGSSNQIVGNCFSPSGKYYTDINDQFGFSIFEFDRCTGLLSAERRVDYPPDAEPNYYRNRSGTGGVFSSDDHFFYKTTTFSASPSSFAFLGYVPLLRQYDLSVSHLSTSVDTVNYLDTLNYWPYNILVDQFLGAELAPDGRIYVVSKGVSYCTVQYPNIRGKDCKFVYNKPYFGVDKGSAIPYMPNYRLGPLDGSPCDTLGLNNIPVANFRTDDSLNPRARYFYDLSHHEPALWFWTFGDGISSNEQSPLHQYDSAGVYQVCLTVTNVYGSDTHCRTLYLGVSGKQAPLAHNLVTVRPNPFSRQLAVTLDTGLRGAIFRLYNQMGNLLREERLAPGITEIETNALPKGMYFWEVTSNGTRISTGKVVKME